MPREFPEFMTPFRVTTEQKAKAKRLALKYGVKTPAGLWRMYLDAEKE